MAEGKDILKENYTISQNDNKYVVKYIITIKDEI